MRICGNQKCAAFGRIVYSLGTRCPLCKWDLKISPPASEAHTAKSDAVSNVSR